MNRYGWLMSSIMNTTGDLGYMVKQANEAPQGAARFNFDNLNMDQIKSQSSVWLSEAMVVGGRRIDDHSYMEEALIISGVLLSDDASVVLPLDDIAIPFILGGAYILDRVYRSGNTNYPGPWSTDRPNNYIPRPMSSINNKTFFPEGNGKDFIKWALRLGGASVLAKKLYDGFYLQPDSMPVDNANFVKPLPPFYTPIPNPNRP